MTPELQDLLDLAVRRVNDMTEEQRVAMYAEQQRSLRTALLSGAQETVAIVLPASVVVKPEDALQRPQEPDYRAILINLVASVIGSENMGDVSEDCVKALKLAGVAVPDTCDNDPQLSDWLGAEFGAVGVWGMKP